MLSGTVSRFANDAGRLAALAVGFTLPISVALDNTLLTIMLAGWIAGGHYADKLAAARNNIVCIGALVLFSALALGAFYGVQSSADARSSLLKYLDLALVPIFAYYFRDPAMRRNGLLIFAAAMTLVLTYSFLVRFGVLDLGSLIRGSISSPVVFKFRVTHNFLMAFSAFLFTWLAIASQSRSEKVGCYELAALAAFNVTLMVEGATGYIILFALALLLVFNLLSRRHVIAAIVAISLFMGLLVVTPGPLSSRLSLIAKEMQTWRPDNAAQHSSAGLRLEFYKNTLKIIAEHPIAGVGTGGFAKAYAEKVQGTEKTKTENPHNEYLMVAAQTGLIGLAALLGLFATQWMAAKHLSTKLETGLARGLVLTMVIGCLFNSFLLDHTEGLFYAWFTGLLYSGLKYGPRDQSPVPA